MKPPPISPQLLDKYLQNACTPPEKEQVEAWYASLEGETDFLDTLPESAQRQLQEETFRNIQEEKDRPEPSVVRTLPLVRIAWLAASIALVLGTYFTYRYSTSTVRPVVQAPMLASGSTRPLAGSSVHFVNRASRPVRHRLPDGSTVWMQAGAAITYPAQFARRQRLVDFSGEGFFDVKKDKSCPFYIQSGEMTIKVLGTSFNVKALAARKFFQVAVVTGRVQVTAPDRQQQAQQVVLTPQQQAVFETDSKRLVASLMPVQSRKELYEAITVVFDETPLNQVVDRLQKRFNIQIRLANPKLALCRVSADFEQQSLPLILEMLCTTLDATYTMTDKSVTIDGAPCE
ncbi:FecR family protein [Spirosoma koreense]